MSEYCFTSIGPPSGPECSTRSLNRPRCRPRSTSGPRLSASLNLVLVMMIGGPSSRSSVRVHDRTHVGPPLATAGLGRRYQWCNIRPLVIREVARVPQVITIVFRSVLKRPHRRPLRESGHLL